MKLLGVLICSIVATGCAALTAAGSATTSTPTSSLLTVSAMPKPSNFDYVGKSDTRLAFVNPASLLTGSRRVEAKVIEEQCTYKSADPPFFVPNDKTDGSWTFAGRLNDDGSLQALDYQSVFSLGIGEGAQQVGTWPVRLATLSDFPDIYLEDRLAFVGADKIDGADQNALTREFIANRQRLETRVAELEQSYDPLEECPPQR